MIDALVKTLFEYHVFLATKQLKGHSIKATLIVNALFWMTLISMDSYWTLNKKHLDKVLFKYLFSSNILSLDTNFSQVSSVAWIVSTTSFFEEHSHKYSQRLSCGELFWVITNVYRYKQIKTNLYGKTYLRFYRLFSI